MRAIVTVAAVVVMVAVAAPRHAVGDAGSDKLKTIPRVENSDYRAGREAVEAERFDRAIEYLERAVIADPNNADALNLLGYSHRKLGRFDESLGFYQKALAVNPNHLGANEYLGELYLQMGDLAKAEERLRKLDDLCFFGCEEYDDLKKAIAAYKALPPSATTTR